MANKYTDAADAIKREAGRLRGFLSLAEMLDSIGSLEQTRTEASKAAGAALQEREALEGEVKRLKAEVKKHKDAQAKAQADAADKLAAMSDETHRAAQAKAAGVIDAANTAAAEITARTQREAAALQEQMAAWTTRIEELQGEERALEASLASLRREEAAVAGAIDKLKEQFR